jgi:hypothetical protein
MNRMKAKKTGLKCFSSKKLSISSDESSINFGKEDGLEEVNTIPSTPSPKKKKKMETKETMVSPIVAKDIQRKLLQRHKKQIHEKNRKSKLSGLFNSDVEEKDFLLKSRESKIFYEEQRHNEMKKFQENKISIDTKRCEINEKCFKMEIDNAELNRERIKAQTKLDEQKRLLVKLEMFKLRQALKKDDPEVTDEYLDQYFAMDEK